ncbi:MAG: beta-ketoacyl-ACP synthase [Cyanophyceae cyanobacterium]
MVVVVTGIGLRSCLGNLALSWQHLLAGQSGIKAHHLFSEMPPLPLGLIGSAPTRLSPLTQELVSAALEDANLTPPLRDCGVVIGSSRSCQAEWEQLASQASSPRKFNWLDTLPHQAAVATARQIGATGTVLAPMAACATGIWALAQGRELIDQSQYQRVVVGAIEAPTTRLTLTGFKQMGALATTGCYPFDREREGLVLGEGGAVFVLESASIALSRGAFIYGKIGGVGLSCDAYHISAPEPSSHSAASAIYQCLANSRWSAKEVDYIHAHGTGTQLNDYREAQLIQKLFGPTVPTSSTKGATGHTLGASGALGTAFSLMALKEQRLPPCVGLRQPEFDLNFVRPLSQTRLRRVLSFNFGFGGQNAVIALETL